MDLPGSGSSSRDLPAKCSRSLPQFSELRSVPTVTAAAAAAIAAIAADGRSVQSQGMQTTPQVVTSPQEASASTLSKLLAASWQDVSTVLQLCDKQVLNQIISVPNYGQNNGTLGAQSSSFNFINNPYLPSTSQADTVKQDSDIQPKEKISDKETEIMIKHNQTAVMADYFHKLSEVPSSLREAFGSVCAEQVKKEKLREEKIEHTQNNILNIPNIRNHFYLQNGNNFANSDHVTVSNDLNLQNEQEIENSLRNVLKVEQQVQTDLPKIEKKPKFRAKIGEIKVSNFDGITFYCCPECNLALPDRTDVEQHIQSHLQERKYQCKECGAMLKRKEHLDQHMRGHSNERPYKCDVCKKAFKRNEHLTRHTVIHSGNKDFACSMCQKAFSRKDHLNKHLQTHLGIRKNKMKEDSYFFEQKDTTRVFDNSIDIAAAPKQEISYTLKDSSLSKQENAFLQQFQNFQKNPTLLHTFASLKEHMKDITMPEQAQSSNMNENSRYIMPS
ncbi:zinc finger protein 90 homolog [Monomorium pharaonis]|uniref:zinc finger protein 90 homolog n=1 Tax=Monomorium pharaonis TaxID=307658 RepID=UPI00063F160C|nr:zinc finger protein 90 homolog [Monomorium pharaonis]